MHPPPPEMKVSGALCLMSDLTELTALQKQIRWKENLAALGEMSAGIAHEFKNALATISGYAQMIRSEAARPGDIRDSAERILDQTRALTHVVTEFLRFAKPLEICYETVPMKTLVERVAEELQEANPECAVECEGSFEELPGDEALLRQALVNLTRNGAEAAREAAKSGRVRHSRHNRGTGRPKMAAYLRSRQWPGNPGHRFAQNLPSLLHHKIRRHRTGPGRRPEGGSTAWRQHRSTQPPGRRGGVPALVTFAAGALADSIPLACRPHLNYRQAYSTGASREALAMRKALLIATAAALVVFPGDSSCASSRTRRSRRNSLPAHRAPRETARRVRLLSRNRSLKPHAERARTEKRHSNSGEGVHER